MARRAAAFFLLAGSLLCPMLAAALAAPSLEAVQVSSPTGSSQTILRIADIGRYSVSAQSPTGASFEIVDRMAGRIASGAPGPGVSASTGRQARVDLYLEPGEYKLRVTHAPAETVALQVRRFDAVNAGAAVPPLFDGQTVRGELDDLQLYQYWVTVDAAHPALLLEAWGRGLKDVAVWKDGMWDTGLRPTASTIELEPGRPLTVLEVNARLEPGAYLVTCAGGAPAPWVKDNSARPFFVTRGARFLGEMGRMSLTLPAQGTASFLVSGNVGTVEMQAPRARPFRLVLGANVPGGSRYAGAQAGIDEKSSSLRCRVNGPGGAETSWVTVQGPPGDTVELTWIGAGGAGALRPFPESGSYLASVLSSLEADSSMDATGLIVQASRERGRDPLEVRAVQALAVSADRPLRRQVNCLGELTFLLRPERGTYAVVEKDRAAASARYDFRLLDDALLSGSAAPVRVNSGGRVTLTDKLYLVSVNPVKAGVLDFAIVPASILGRARTADVFSGPPPRPETGISWPSTAVTQTGTVSAFLVLPPRQGVSQGFVVRRLPADLSQPLPILVGAGREASFPFSLPREAALVSTSSAFSESSVRVDSAPWAPGRVYSAGTHTLTVSNPASLEQWHVISAVEPERPALALAPGQAAAAETLPALPEAAPAWRTFDRSQVASFLLQVPAPGSYRIGTLGRLAMGLAVRTPLRRAFAEAAENVDGRNAEITAYLRPGTYMVQASARGYSAGRAGVVLERLPVVPAGTVRDGEVLRAAVPAGQVMQAEIQVAAAGDYAAECLGLGRAFPWRLEDGEGWPLGEPVRQGVLSEHMEAGTYRFLSLASRESTRRVLSFRAVERPAAVDRNARRAVLALNQPVRKTWNESEGRAPDVFTVTLAAEVRASLSLSPGMLFKLVDARGAVPWQGIGGKVLPVTLHAGEWRLEVTSLLEDNQKPYEVTLATADLLPGTPQAVSASPQVLPVSVGAPGTVEIWSYGGSELDAFLTDESGRLVAQGQPIPDDWNFRVLAQVAPGRYLLHVSSPAAVPAAPAAAQPAPRPAAQEEPVEDEGGGYESGDEENPAGDEDTGDYEPDEGGDYGGQDEYVDEPGSEEEPGGPAPPAPAAAPPAPAAQPLGGMSIVRLVVREEKLLAAAAGTLDAAVELGQEIAVAPFTAPDEGVYRFSGQSAAPVTVAVFREGRLLAAGPSPLRIALGKDRRYTLRFWTFSPLRAGVALRAGLEPAQEVSSDGAVDARAPALRLAFPPGTSYRLEAEAGALWYAPGPEVPFQPLEDAAVSSAGAAGWAVRPDGSSLGACRVSMPALADGVTEAVMIGSAEGSFQVRVPGRTAALVRTENMGRVVGLSASPVTARASAGVFDWSGASAEAAQSVLGLREGSFRGRLWSTDPAGGADRRVRVSARMLPVASEEALGKGVKELTVPGGTAAAVSVAAGQRAVEVSLDRGMVAFGWNNGPTGVVDASADSTTGRLDAAGGSIVIMNPLSAPGLCTVREAAAVMPLEISESASWESGRAAGEVSLAVRAARSPLRLYVYGAVERARLYSQEDGRVYEGEPAGSDLGALLAFPAQRGRLVVRAGPGPVRAWMAAPDQVLGAFVGRDPRARQAALPPEGGALQAGAQAWTVTLDSDSIVLLRADGDGVLAVFGPAGACLQAAASPVSRSLVARLPRGSFTVYTRPFADGAAAGGLVTMRTLPARTLEADGVGAEALIGSRDAALYRFTVAERGRVGCGVRAASDTLTATLLDSRFDRVGTGRVFVRTLAPGVYYLLVEAGGKAERFAPVIYGLEGSTARIPDDVMSSYQGE